MNADREISKLTSAILTDVYRAEHRGKSLALATLLPYLGPAIGPIIGGVASQRLDWSWLFWILSIVDAIITVIVIVVLTETYTPVLLRRKALSEQNSLRSTSAGGEEKIPSELWTRFRGNIQRPVLLLLQRPMIQVASLIIALNFGIYCLMLSTYATLWIDRYHETPIVSSLNYISLAIGSTLASQCGGYMMDFIYRRLKKINKGHTNPEFRVPSLIPGAVLIPSGLFWYGWAAETNASWVLVDFGAVVFTFGSFLFSQGMLAYILDEMKHAASANAASRMLSNILGFAFPIFAPQMYGCLGYGWGNSVLAFVFIGLGTPIPVILWIWGSRLRALGRRD